MRLIPETNPQQETEVHAKRQNEYKYITSQRLHRGHILFEFNTKTNEIRQAELDKRISVNVYGKPVTEIRVVRKPDCIYVQALNAANAKKIVKAAIKSIIKSKSNND